MNQLLTLNESRSCSSSSVISWKQHEQNIDGMDTPLLGYELLLFRRFQHQPALWYEWRERLWRRADPSAETLETVCLSDDTKLLTLVSLEELGIGDIHQDLWFLSVMLHKRPKHFMKMVKMEIEREKHKRFPKPGETLLMRYLLLHNFTVFSLDSMFKFGDDNKLPRELFKCPNVKYLSLKYNGLEYLPCDIGRMSKLEYLALTNNKLSVWSLPYSLTFLTNLQTLLLDNNLLDALPGFLTSLPSLKTVHRHGNHNYFKSTFMWYHTDVNLRIIAVPGDAMAYDKHESLLFWAAKAVIASKRNFFEDRDISPVLKDYISEVYTYFNICHHCLSACLASSLGVSGFKVITFKNPYLGNTCVPFQHWACSLECARAVEIPAREEQIAAARELDQQYLDYIKDCVRKFSACRSPRSMLACAGGASASQDLSLPAAPQGLESKRSECVSWVEDNAWPLYAHPGHTGGRRARDRKGRRSRKVVLPTDSSRTKCQCVVS